jgi:hypothetical protein
MFVVCGKNVGLGITNTMDEAIASLKKTRGCSPLVQHPLYQEWLGMDEDGFYCILTVVQVKPGPGPLFGS